MSKRFKRLIDVVISAAALLFLAPVVAILALLIRWKIGAPATFRQLRPGLHGVPFAIVKFRTMRDLAEGEVLIRDDGLRLSAFGRALRAISADELPTFWNVLKGDMSLVGPRPLMMQYLERYTPEQARRHEVRPGITGWAQVNGRNAISWEQKFAYDVWYVDHQSLALDLKILLLTVGRVLRREGVKSANHATMTEFQGYPISQEDT